MRRCHSFLSPLFPITSSPLASDADISYAVDEYDAIKGADALVIITEWNQFRALDMEKVKSLLRSPKIADLRNIYEPADMRELGFAGDGF